MLAQTLLRTHAARAEQRARMVVASACAEAFAVLAALRSAVFRVVGYLIR
ncbi:MAG TPA: hypothetical protein VHT53_04895 [Candidatus Elarobacter sp.]|nr:hypothetical protein [Candidatus Elarobacter sp.]